MVGIIGEMHAYRYLQKEFEDGRSVRAHGSRSRGLKVRPLVEGEKDEISDGARIRLPGSLTKASDGHVEVKATKGDDTSFDLGISEIEAATRIAGGAATPGDGESSGCVAP